MEVTLEEGFKNNMKKIERKSECAKIEIILYKRRWFMLTLFILFSVSNFIQYFHYTVIANVIHQYYGVSYTMINWSTMINAVMLPTLFFPGCYVIDKIGIRNTVLIGTIGTSTGTCIKFLSIHPDRFWVAILAQGVVSTFHITLLPLLPKVTAAWFGIKEVATANSMGITGILIGTSLAFLLPPLMITSGEPAKIETYLTNLTTIYSFFALIMAVLIFCFFSDAPPSPPSVAQRNSIVSKQSEKHFIRILETAKDLLYNRSYVIFVFIFSINTRSLSPIQTMLNEIILFYYPTATQDVGIIGLFLYALGIIGAIGIGVILDKSKSFKKTIYVTYSVYFVSIAIFICVLNQGLKFVYISTIMMGIFHASLTTSAIELCLELTYPAAQNISIGFLIIANSIVAIVDVSLYSWVFEVLGVFPANVALLIVLFLTNLLFYFVKFDLRRQAAQSILTELDPLIS